MTGVQTCALPISLPISALAAEMAWQDSGLSVNDENNQRIDVITGCGMGGLPTIEESPVGGRHQGHVSLRTQVEGLPGVDVHEHLRGQGENGALPDIDVRPCDQPR